MTQTMARFSPASPRAQAFLPSMPVAVHPRVRDSRKVACPHCVVARIPSFELQRASVVQGMADTLFVAASKRNGAVVVTAQCDESRRIARLPSLLKDIRHTPRDYRAVDTRRRARSNSTAAD